MMGRLVPHPRVRTLVSSAFLVGILGVFIFQTVESGRSPSTILVLTVIALTLASAYSVFGKKNVEDAIESAQDLTGNDSDSEDTDSENSGSDGESET